MDRTNPSRSKALLMLAAISVACIAARPNRATADEPAKPKSVDRSADDDLNPHPVFPAQPGDYKLKFRTHIGDQPVEMPYVLHLPPDYNKDPRQKHPMLVFFHGLGERGTDLGGVFSLGPLPMLSGSPAFAASCPFILVCPQCSPDATWDSETMYKTAVRIVDQAVRNTRTDADRVYATGLSMGGLGSWCVAEESPDLFAAIAPLSAMAWHPEQAADKLKYINVWAVTGVNDQPRFTDGAKAMQAALAHNPLVARFTYFVDKGHEAWSPPFQSMGFYEWFLSHRRLTPVQRKKLDAQSPPPEEAPLPTGPGHYLLNFLVKIGNQPFHMDYLLYLPKGYKPNTTPRPAMLFLAEQDTMGPVFHDLCVHGPDLELEKKPGLQGNFPFIVISPRAPIDCDWNKPGMTRALLDLLDHLSQSIGIDTTRVCVTGINAGADGAWKLAAEAPDRFSAIAPVVTAGAFTPPDDKAAVLSTIPGRVYVKQDDQTSANRMSQLIKTTKMDWRLLKMPPGTSCIVDVPPYSDHQFLTWLQLQHRTAGPVAGAK